LIAEPLLASDDALYCMDLGGYSRCLYSAHFRIPVRFCAALGRRNVCGLIYLGVLQVCNISSSSVCSQAQSADDGDTNGIGGEMAGRTGRRVLIPYLTSHVFKCWFQENGCVTQFPMVPEQLHMCIWCIYPAV
jgi:hypothetical protein